MQTPDYEFTSDWFTPRSEVWRRLLDEHRPSKLLEIGSWEGRSSCFLIEQCAAAKSIELHCIDTWEGGFEHDRNYMSEVERRFDSNVDVAKLRVTGPVSLVKHKKTSLTALSSLLAEGRIGYFDFIYIDGSHQAPDVLTDAVLAFPLLRVGGLMFFDDYLWSYEPEGHQEYYNMPKPAIDSFVNVFYRKIRLIEAPLYQLYLRKTQA